MSKLQQAAVGMIIYLERLLPAASSNLPKAGGPRQRFCSVLLRMGFTYALSVTREAVVSYTALPPLPGICRAVYFCCTILRVASTGRYPASCPVKPGLSSPAAFRHLQLRLSVLLVNAHFTTRDGKSKVGMIKKKKLSAPYFLQNRKLSIPATQIIINYLHCCYCQ